MILLFFPEGEIMPITQNTILIFHKIEVNHLLFLDSSLWTTTLPLMTNSLHFMHLFQVRAPSDLLPYSVQYPENSF